MSETAIAAPLTSIVIEPKILYPGTPVVLMRILRVHACLSILKSGGQHIDPASWQPLLYNFRRYHGLGPELGRSFREPA